MDRRARRWHRPAVTACSQLVNGDEVVIEGIIEVDDGACARFDDGAAAAAASVEFPRSSKAEGQDRRGGGVAARVRAGGLRLVLSDGEVTLEGEIEVLCGSRESYATRSVISLPKPQWERLRAAYDGEVMGRGRPIMRAVSAKDRVRARGVVAASASSSGPQGYREGAGLDVARRF